MRCGLVAPLGQALAFWLYGPSNDAGVTPTPSARRYASRPVVITAESTRRGPSRSPSDIGHIRTVTMRPAANEAVSSPLM